jgi:hypothetical protein
MNMNMDMDIDMAMDKDTDMDTDSNAHRHWNRHWHSKMRRSGLAQPTRTRLLTSGVTHCKWKNMKYQSANLVPIGVSNKMSEYVILGSQCPTRWMDMRYFAPSILQNERICDTCLPVFNKMSGFEILRSQHPAKWADMWYLAPSVQQDEWIWDT